MSQDISFRVDHVHALVKKTGKHELLVDQQIQLIQRIFESEIHIQQACPLPIASIKESFFDSLITHDWKREVRADASITGIHSEKPGPIDGMVRLKTGKHVLLEWPWHSPDNAHLALNKLAASMLFGTVVAGILIVPNQTSQSFIKGKGLNGDHIKGYEQVWQGMLDQTEEAYLYVLEYSVVPSLVIQ